MRAQQRDLVRSRVVVFLGSLLRAQQRDLVRSRGVVSERMAITFDVDVWLGVDAGRWTLTAKLSLRVVEESLRQEKLDGAERATGRGQGDQGRAGAVRGQSSSTIRRRPSPRQSGRQITGAWQIFSLSLSLIDVSLPLVVSLTVSLSLPLVVSRSLIHRLSLPHSFPLSPSQRLSLPRSLCLTHSLSHSLLLSLTHSLCVLFSSPHALFSSPHALCLSHPPRPPHSFFSHTHLERYLVHSFFHLPLTPSLTNALSLSLSTPLTHCLSLLVLSLTLVLSLIPIDCLSNMSFIIVLTPLSLTHFSHTCEAERTRVRVMEKRRVRQ